MNIMVLGAGAMGSLFGGLLAHTGHRVTLLDVNTGHIDAVRTHGLRLHTDRVDACVRLPIGRPDEMSGTPDWLIVFTKTLHTRAALASAQHLIGPHTRLLTLQNGLGNAELLAQWAAPERIAVGVITVPADLVGPGHVASHGQGGIKLLRADGQADAAVTQLAEALSAADLPCVVDPAAREALWEKVAFNAALNGACALGRCSVGVLGRQPAARALVQGIVAEVLAVAHAQGLAVKAERVARTVDHAMDHHLDHQPSMLQDMLAGRPTEVDAIQGAVVEAAARYGVAVPLTTAVATLVRLVSSQACAAGVGPVQPPCQAS